MSKTRSKVNRGGAVRPVERDGRARATDSPRVVNGPGARGPRAGALSLRAASPAHPLAEAFPLLEGEAFEAFCDDIRTNGQRVPILRHKGTVIDGRNRERACFRLDIHPKYAEWDGKGSLAQIVAALNIQRRHLTPSQKIGAAVELEAQLAIEAEKRMKAGIPVSDEERGRAAEIASRICRVSKTHICNAKLVKRNDPEAYRRIIAGTLTVSQAQVQVRRRLRAAMNDKKLADLPSRRGDWRLICGDAVKELENFPNKHFRLIFMDPVYNLGFSYDSDPARDRLPPDKYLSLCRQRIGASERVLAKDGTMLLMNVEEWQHHMLLMLQDAGLHLRRTIVWYERFGQNARDNLNRTCRYIHYVVRNPNNFIFDETALLTDSRRLLCGDKSLRPDGSPRVMPGGKNLDAFWTPGSVWIEPRVQGTARQRLAGAGAPTQLPIEMMRRVVGGFSEPGDRVLDPMCGTATTGHACVLLGRHFTGIDRSAKYIAAGERRLCLAEPEGTEAKSK